MFVLHHAPNTHALADNLTHIIRSQALKNCFEKEVFLIQTPLLEPWLSQKIATSLTLWAHYQFLLPNAFFKTFSKKIHPDFNPIIFDHDSILWQIEAQLHQVEAIELRPLKNYLQGDNVALKREQLADKITHLFADYSCFRPEFFSAWQQGVYITTDPAEKWQSYLWLKLTEHGNPAVFFNRWQPTIHLLENSPVGHFQYKLPERIFVFGFSHLAPQPLTYLTALAKHCDIHFYLQTPASSINGLQSTNSHALVNSLEQQGREFQQLLLEKTPFSFNAIVPLPQKQPTNLRQLQTDIIQITALPIHLKRDDSMIINACHSKVRELECLKNQLLDCLEKNPGLNWRDIGVLAPDIHAYTPFISAIFDTIPHSYPSTTDNAIFNHFLQFLQLIHQRFEWQAVLDLLERSTIFPSFDLSETDITTLKHWLKATNVRWAKSSQHKQQLGLPPLTENTWQATLARLLMGYAVGSDANFVDDILPYHAIEGGSAQALGGFNDFLQLLFNASEMVSTPKSFQAWGDCFYVYATELFSQHEDAQEIYHLFKNFPTLLDNEPLQKIEFHAIVEWLTHYVTKAEITHGLLRENLNFGSIATLHSIPFKVTAILGLDEGVFPNIEPKSAFDLSALAFKLGDFSSRKNQRQQFLNCLMNTEQCLILSYIGQSQTHNNRIPPSVIISELLDVMQRDYQIEDLLIKHPLQPFSFRYFNQSDPCLFSYSTQEMTTAIALSQTPKTVENWWQTPIHHDKNSILDLTHLQKFYRHPQRYFMQTQLDVRLQSLADPIEAHEPFSLSALENYKITHDWIDSLLAQQSFDLKKLQAQGHWLSGVLGEVEFKQQQHKIVEFVTQIQALNLGDPIENKAIALNISSVQLTGKLYNLHQHGSLFYRYANLKGKDLLLAWLHHCLINQLEPQETHLISKDYALLFTTGHQSVETLEKLIQIYDQGLQDPTIIWVDIALEYVKQVHKLNTSTRTQKPALAIAVDKLKLSLETDYELEFQRLYGQTEHISALFSTEFIDFCENLLAPLWVSLISKKL
ncbi:MAG: exodeoxyribonuclease V subunit gamma [Methylococcales bacterium]|nr:exodeoxyribonuclease V subunit gamma [Methylococcales bacterium]